MKRALVLAALLACAPAPAAEIPIAPVDAPPGSALEEPPRSYSVVIHGDTRFEAFERDLAEYAAQSWFKLSRGRIDIVLKWDLDEPNLVRLRDSPRMIRVSSEDPRSQRVSAAHRLPANVHLASWTHMPDQHLPLIIGIIPHQAAELTPIFLHEFGHAAGLDDLPGNERGIMSVAFGTWKFTKADYEHCQRARLCAGPPPEGLS